MLSNYPRVLSLYFISFCLFFSFIYGQPQNRTKVEYYVDGKRITEVEFERRGKTAETVEFYENGKQKAKGKIYKGKKHGLWYGWYKNRERWYEGEYKDGTDVGGWVFFYNSGAKKTK